MMTPDPAEKSKIDRYLAQSILAQVATADPVTHQPHVVPVWYEWDGEYLWFSGYRSTRKFKELARNPLVSIVVDTPEAVDGVRGVLLEGKADLFYEPADLIQKKSTDIYLRYLGEEGTMEAEPQEWIHDPENMVVRLKPARLLAF